MSVATEISRLQTAKSDIKTAIEAKGVEVPSSAKIDEYDDYISQIPSGGYNNISLGVYAAYSDGTLKTYSEADTNAIGVAIITSKCAFGIVKDSTTLKSVHTTPYSYGVSSDADALLDYEGERNTKCYIRYSDTSDTDITSAVDGYNYRGYIGSLGEWKTYIENKEEVDAMMSKIGGGDIMPRDGMVIQDNMAVNLNLFFAIPNNLGNPLNALKYPGPQCTNTGRYFLTSTRDITSFNHYHTEYRRYCIGNGYTKYQFCTEEIMSQNPSYNHNNLPETPVTYYERGSLVEKHGCFLILSYEDGWSYTLEDISNYSRPFFNLTYWLTK